MSKKYEYIRHLGSGSSATVIVARAIDSGDLVAIRLVKPEHLLWREGHYVKGEILNHGALRHPHVIQWRESFVTTRGVNIVTDYASGGSLADLVAARGRLGEPLARWFLQQLVVALDYCHRKQLVVALDYCHRKGVAHRGIKLGNLLLAPSPASGTPALLKVSGFSLSAPLQPERPSAARGAPAHVAPEVLDRVEVEDAAKADVWSSGVALYTMLAGHPPPPGGGPPPPLPEGAASPACAALMARMLTRCPQGRPSVAEVMQDPWFLADLPAAALQMNDELLAAAAGGDGSTSTSSGSGGAAGPARAAGAAPGPERGGGGDEGVRALVGLAVAAAAASTAFSRRGGGGGAAEGDPGILGMPFGASGPGSSGGGGGGQAAPPPYALQGQPLGAPVLGGGPGAVGALLLAPQGSGHVPGGFPSQPALPPGTGAPPLPPPQQLWPPPGGHAQWQQQPPPSWPWPDGGACGGAAAPTSPGCAAAGAAGSAAGVGSPYSEVDLWCTLDDSLGPCQPPPGAAAAPDAYPWAAQSGLPPGWGAAAAAPPPAASCGAAARWAALPPLLASPLEGLVGGTHAFHFAPLLPHPAAGQRMKPPHPDSPASWGPPGAAAAAPSAPPPPHDGGGGGVGRGACGAGGGAPKRRRRGAAAAGGRGAAGSAAGGGGAAAGGGGAASDGGEGAESAERELGRGSYIAARVIKLLLAPAAPDA
ncbi:MAG: kinase-like domain-containing protein [Monoraphidium minutum]|nr:MAG: kinase-like domain-containing protein [Monoraphidium minutum]